MILPSKGIPIDRALLTIGAEILLVLRSPRTVSETWEEMRTRRAKAGQELAFEQFVLGMDWLFIVGAVDLVEGLLVKARATGAET